MADNWTTSLVRWQEAGLIDAETAARIRAFEQDHAGSTRLRWPILVALGFGALMLGGGVLLFVAAHWDALSPTERFAIVIVLVGGFHVLGALVADRFAGMASALHAVGTVALGGGIALAGQIFNLDEHWPAGLMMWAAGAVIGWAVLRQLPQLVLTAILAPAWVASEWIVAFDQQMEGTAGRILASGLFLLSLAYFTAAGPGPATDRRRALVWLGGLTILPIALMLTAMSSEGWWRRESEMALSGFRLTLASAVAIGGPLALAFALRHLAAWPNVVAAVWVLGLLHVRGIAGEISLYVWWALGAIGLVAWGVRDGRSERVNMGAAIFAVTVVAFYFSHVMDKLGRSASLIGLGLLFLGGGWALEHVRRRLIVQTRGSA